MFKGKNIGWAVAGIISVLLLLTAAYVREQSHQSKVLEKSTKQPAAQKPVPKTADKTASNELMHVVIIVEENKPASTIVGNAKAPFLNQLIKQNAYAAKYSAVTNPSLPNYIALTSGTTAGIDNDCNPPNEICQAPVVSIADTLEKSGRTWKMYAESMPAPCTANNDGQYAVKHNPFMYYPDIRNNAERCNAHVVPFSQFSTDLATETSLPSYAFIAPDLCHDMHDCDIAAGDAWLAEQVPKILASPAFTKQRSLLVVVFDEGTRTDNIVPAVFAGSAALPNYRTDAPYNHYSLLHTIEVAWKLPALTKADAGSPLMNEMLR